MARSRVGHAWLVIRALWAQTWHIIIPLPIYLAIVGLHVLDWAWALSLGSIVALWAYVIVRS